MDNNLKKLFENRTCVVATMHKKEQVIAPILEQELGLRVMIPEEFNTDAFGTFTKEVERAGDQLEAARKKVEKAMHDSGQSIGISSEGSFGPHPHFPFVSYNRELIFFFDKELDLEITGYAANSETNFAQREIASFEEAYEFALSIGFPKHGVILKKHATDQNELIKGITDENELKKAVSKLLCTSSPFSLKKLLKKSTKSIFIETDMRAMFNPTRMKNIELATLDLISKIQSFCPSCDTPGFEVIQAEKGLKCMYCNLPTELIRSHVYQCKKCNHQKEVMYPDGKEYADPTYCNDCNP